MRIKKFKADSLNAALKQVREQLGENALILSTKRHKAGGSGNASYVEVVAAVDEMTAKRRARTQRTSSVPQQAAAGRSARRTHFAARMYQQNAGEEGESLATVSSMQTAETRKPAAGASPEPHAAPAIDVNHPVLMRLYAAMKVAGVHHEMIRRLTHDLSLEIPHGGLNSVERLQEALKSGFMKLIRYAPLDIRQAPKPMAIAFVGPTGVGKTTTLAKIAARLKIEHKQKVGLISIDTFRIAAIDQLRTFAHIAELPLQVAYQPEELLQALIEYQDMDFILIDTTGRNPRNPEYLDELQRFLMPLHPLQMHLVLSATTRYAEMEEIVQQYSRIGFHRLLLTKIDEVMHPAIVLNLFKLANSPVTWVTNGQNIPEDLLEAGSEALLNAIIRGWDLSKWIS